MRFNPFVALSAFVRRLLSVIDRASEEITRLTKELEETRAMHSQLARVCMDHQRDRDAAKEEAETLKVRLENASKQIMTATREGHSQLLQRQKAEEELKRASLELEGARKEEAFWKNSHKAESDLTIKLQEDAERRNADLERIQRQADDERARRTSAERMLDETRAELEEARTRIGRLENEVRAFANDLNAANAERASLRDEVEKLRTNLSHAEDALDEPVIPSSDQEMTDLIHSFVDAPFPGQSARTALQVKLSLMFRPESEPDASGCCYQVPGGCFRHRRGSMAHATVNVLDLRRAVEAFHIAFNLPAPAFFTEPDAALRHLRVKLLVEEVLEFVTASGFKIRVDELGVDIRPLDGPLNLPSFPQMVDGLIDSLYIILGTFVVLGLDPIPFFWEVHRSNMAKLGPDGRPVMRADGKVLKPAGWTPPALEKLLQDINSGEVDGRSFSLSMATQLMKGGK